MSMITASKKKLAAAAAGASLLAACASVGTEVAWNIPPSGSSWQIEQRNTGSYGTDTTFKTTRGDGVWQGKQVVTFTNSQNGGRVMALPDGRWLAIVSRDGATISSFDPPIGYMYPLSIGQSWSTKHKVTTPRGSSELNYSCKVEGREKVTVPAGTFDTLKIVCENPGVSRDVNWTIVDLGMHAKQEMQRFSGHPQGAGTREARLLAVDRR
jgi:hypothetical protein